MNRYLWILFPSGYSCFYVWGMLNIKSPDPLHILIDMDIKKLSHIISKAAAYVSIPCVTYTSNFPSQKCASLLPNKCKLGIQASLHCYVCITTKLVWLSKCHPFNPHPLSSEKVGGDWHCSILWHFTSNKFGKPNTLEVTPKLHTLCYFHARGKFTGSVCQVPIKGTDSKWY